jgi:acyl-CoA synthetase (AMP-forming)/AMP-acid ligase II
MIDTSSKMRPSTNYGSVTIVDLLRRHAIHQGWRPAYTFLVDGEAEKKNLTYEELDRRSRAIGASLQLAGATGGCALLLYPSGLEFIAAFLGCLYAGVIAIPAYPPLPNRPQQRLQGIIEDSQAAIVLTTNAVIAAAGRVISEMPYAKKLRWIATDDIADRLGEKWREPAINGDTLAMLQYTSGSTSDPKGVMVSHSNLLSNEGMIQKAVRQTKDSVFVGWLPLYHDMGLIGITLQTLFLGARSVLMAPTAFLQKPFRWLQAVSEYRAAVSGGPNFAYDLCVRRISPDQRSRLDLSGWTVAFNGAEPISCETLERFSAAFATCGFRKEAFYPCYGLAEATLFVSGGQTGRMPVVRTFQATALENNRAILTDHEQVGGRHLVGCGNNLSDQRIAIVHPEFLTECLQGEVGEVWVSGPNVAQGYWRHPDETEQLFRAYLPRTGEGPFLRTGDLGFVLDGELFITGRLKDLVIIDGRNHYPQDIELTVQKSHAAIRPGGCAAFSANFDGRERLVVVAEIDRRHRDLDRNEIVKAIRLAVAEQHELRIEHVWLLKTEKVPKTSSGKIQRRACRSNFLSMMAGKI